MTKFTTTSALLVLAALLLATTTTNAQHCRPYGHFEGFNPPEGKCNPNISTCCSEGRIYSAYHCSPPISSEGETLAILTLNNFEADGPTECDSLSHTSEELIVSVSTGWYASGARCGREIMITNRKNGERVRATVVDHCDSRWGCDEERGFEAPCKPNVIDASRAVWRKLGVPEAEWGEMEVTWTDAAA